MVANSQHSSLNNWASSLAAQKTHKLQQPLFGAQQESHCNVLVVAPDRTMRTPLCEHLANLNYYVLTAEECEEILDLLTHKTIALVVLNMSMPAKDGFRICTAIRKSSEVPILIFTDSDRLDDAAYAMVMGADGYITHPFTLSTLKIRLRGLLNSGF